MTTKYSNCEFQISFKGFYDNLQAQGRSLAVPLDGMVKMNIVKLLHSDYKTFPPQKTRRISAQVNQNIATISSICRKVTIVIGNNKGKVNDIGSYTKEYSKWSNAVLNPVWNPINNQVVNEANQDLIVEENRIRLEEMYTNGEILFRQRTTDEIVTVVDNIFTLFSYILLFLSAYIGYTGII